MSTLESVCEYARDLRSQRLIPRYLKLDTVRCPWSSETFGNGPTLFVVYMVSHGSRRHWKNARKLRETDGGDAAAALLSRLSSAVCVCVSRPYAHELAFTLFSIKAAMHTLQCTSNPLRARFEKHIRSHGIKTFVRWWVRLMFHTQGLSEKGKSLYRTVCSSIGVVTEELDASDVSFRWHQLQAQLSESVDSYFAVSTKCVYTDSSTVRARGCLSGKRNHRDASGAWVIMRSPLDARSGGDRMLSKKLTSQKQKQYPSMMDSVMWMPKRARTTTEPDHIPLFVPFIVSQDKQAAYREASNANFRMLARWMFVHKLNSKEKDLCLKQHQDLNKQVPFHVVALRFIQMNNPSLDMDAMVQSLGGGCRVQHVPLLHSSA